jgi:hypothetical protein
MVMTDTDQAAVDLYLRDYRALIARSIRERDGSPIPNGTLAHATVLMEAMFQTASRKIRILTGELNPRVYGTPEVVAYSRQFLADSDHSLEIIFEGDFDENQAARHPLLSAAGPGANLRLWKLKPDFRSRVISHFALMDDDTYRFEADKTKSSAVAAFGNKEFTKVLSDVFQTLRDRACIEMRLPVLA